MSFALFGTTSHMAMLGGSGPARPTLIGTAEVNTTTGSFTIPANCNLLVVCVVTRHNAVAATLNSITCDGSGMSTGRAWTQSSNRVGSGIYYLVNPPTGSKTVTATFSSAPAMASLFAYYFIGDTVTPIGVTGANSSTYSNYLSIALTPQTALPVIVMCAVHTHSSGTGTGTWTGTNLTVDQDYGVAANNTFACGSNQVLENAGSTSFTLTSSWGASYMNVAAAEIRMVS